MAAGTGLHLAAAALAWLLGIGLQLQQPALWPASRYAWMAAGALALLLAAVALRRRAGRAAWVPRACLLLALALLGFACTAGRAAWRLAEALPPSLEGVELRLTGVVAGLPQPGPQGTRFVFQVEQAQQGGRPVAVPDRVSLAWQRGFDGDVLVAAPAQEIRAGQRWQFTARLRQPHGNLNPHGFDLELWLFEQGLRATGSVLATGADPPRLLAEGVGQPVGRARQAVRDAILLRVPDAGAAGVLAALAVGDQAAIWVATKKTNPRLNPPAHGGRYRNHRRSKPELSESIKFSSPRHLVFRVPSCARKSQVESELSP